MMIRIRYPDGRFDMVKGTRLEYLIATKWISGFRRATGWVVIGRDPIRKNSEEAYCGPERRDSMVPPAASMVKKQGNWTSVFYRSEEVRCQVGRKPSL